MKRSPRTNVVVLLSLLSVLVLAPHAARAQTRSRNRTPPRPKSIAENKDAVAARRQEAVNLLRETAERARSFDDLFYRSHIQMFVADALWNYDQERARLIFRRAWEAATASDKALQEEFEQRNGPDSEEAKGFIMDARYEVILKASARDPVMGEAFLKEYWKEKKEKEQEAQSQPKARTLWGQSSAADAQRLGFADDLLARGESESAARLAAPLISRGVRADIVAFIIRLREQNVAASDRLYAMLLAQVHADTGADANTVLLLSAPVISPELLVVVGDGGTLQLRPLPRKSSETTKATPITGTLRGAFYKTAAELLLRPSSATPDATGQTQQMVALYLAIGRLLPFFEGEAAQYAPELRARAHALAGDMEQSRRDMLTSHFDPERETSTGTGDPLRAASEQLSRAANETERDRLRLGIVRLAVRNRLWDRARRTAAEIDNAESRRAALSFVAVSQIADLSHTYADQEESDYEAIVKFLNGADVPALARAWGYAQAATIAARKEDSRDAALWLLTEAESYAGRVDQRTSQRVAAYAIVAEAAVRVDEARAWTLLSEVVRAANAVEDFAGDEVSLDIMATETSTEDAPDYFSVTGEAFRFDKIFATMSKIDWTKTLAQARSLDGDVPQAFVFIAMARAALDQKKG
jgi:hypothetical protein